MTDPNYVPRPSIHEGTWTEDQQWVSQMKPRSPAARVDQAVAAFRSEISKAIAEAEMWNPGDHDKGLPFGAFIRAHREMLGISLDEVARRAGSTKSHIWELERGRSKNPTVKMVHNIAVALGIPAMALFNAALREIAP